MEDLDIVTVSTMPYKAVTDTFEGHPHIEAVYGQLNIILFVVGTLFNILVSWVIKKQGIKTPVDVALLLIALCNWVRVLLDLGVGITYIKSGKPVFSGSHLLTQLWGFANLATDHWFMALVLLLVLSNLYKKTKTTTLILGVCWLMIESLLLLVPMAMGGVYKRVGYVPHPAPQYSDFEDKTGAMGYLVWVLVTNKLPYFLFYCLTTLLTVCNTVVYLQTKRGLRTEPPKKQQDTLLCVSLGCVFLLSDVTELCSELYWCGVMLLGDLTSDSYYNIQYSLFLARLFVNSARAALFPLAVLIVRCSAGFHLLVARAVKIQDALRPGRYKAFTDKDAAQWGSVEEYNMDEEE